MMDVYWSNNGLFLLLGLLCTSVAIIGLSGRPLNIWWCVRAALLVTVTTAVAIVSAQIGVQAIL
jgi:hypothetical protein